MNITPFRAKPAVKEPEKKTEKPLSAVELQAESSLVSSVCAEVSWSSVVRGEQT